MEYKKYLSAFLTKTIEFFFQDYDVQKGMNNALGITTVNGSISSLKMISPSGRSIFLVKLDDCGHVVIVNTGTSVCQQLQMDAVNFLQMDYTHYLEMQ